MEFCQSIRRRRFHFEDSGSPYATTLRHWRERFLANLEQVRALDFSEAFIRLWEFYFCYCRYYQLVELQIPFTRVRCLRRLGRPLGARRM